MSDSKTQRTSLRASKPGNDRSLDRAVEAVRRSDHRSPFPRSTINEIAIRVSTSSGEFFTHRAPGTALGVGADARGSSACGPAWSSRSRRHAGRSRHFVAGADPRSLDTSARGQSLRHAAMERSRGGLHSAGAPTCRRALARCVCARLHGPRLKHRVDLVGGDTTRGPLAMTRADHGRSAQWPGVAARSRRPGDDVWVSGRLGVPLRACGDQKGGSAFHPASGRALEHGS